MWIKVELFNPELHRNFVRFFLARQLKIFEDDFKVKFGADIFGRLINDVALLVHRIAILVQVVGPLQDEITLDDFGLPVQLKVAHNVMDVEISDVDPIALILNPSLYILNFEFLSLFSRFWVLVKGLISVSLIRKVEIATNPA